jgi:hypothetical protein
MTRAVKLFGAAEALREATGNLRPPVTSGLHYTDGAAQAKAQLGEEVFAAPRAEGRALTLEEATAMADSSP